MPNKLSSIDHIIVLMLENRSFDQMLGYLYAPGPDFDGLTGNESNPDDAGRDVRVFPIQATDDHPYLMPGADPGEGFYNTNYQLFSTDDPAPDAVPTNKGFIVNFKASIAADLAKHYSDTLPGTDPHEIMGMYTEALLPVMYKLAKEFAVCDRWFASAPTQTIPNRAFAAAATSQGHLDNHVKVFTCPSIFGRLTDAKLDWAIYGYNSDPKTRMDFTDTQTADPSHYGHFRDFQDRAAAGTLPEYTFLEPSWGAGGNSQHPNYDVALGEQLMRDTYYAVRNGPGWNNTLLIITYDEHGGNFDHVAPPSDAVAPDDSVGEFGFDFKRFGVRVPAILISPLIVPGTVFRAAQGTIDHTSILSTIEKRWSLEPLTRRDAAAPDLGDVLTLAIPRTDDPLKSTQAPVSSTPHPDQSQPSIIEKLHASQVSKLPMRNEQGSYEHTPPDLTSSAAIGDYIQGRTAAWSQHLERRKVRRKARQAKPSKTLKATKKPSPSKPKRKKKR